MPNSFTIAPGVIAGNLSVGGKITASGSPLTFGPSSALAVGSVFRDFVQHVHTGDITTDTIYTCTIKANTLGLTGFIRVTALYSCTTQGATAASVAISFGGVSLATDSISATGSRVFTVIIGNQGATNANLRASALLKDTPTLIIGSGGITVDTTVDQTLTLTATNGTSTDQQVFDAFIVEVCGT